VSGLPMEPFLASTDIIDWKHPAVLLSRDSNGAPFSLRGLLRGYVQILCVRADCHRQGLGSALLRWAEERIFRDSPNVFICVSSFNAGARRLYERLGFELVGTLRELLVPGHDELLLRKTRGTCAMRILMLIAVIVALPKLVSAKRLRRTMALNWTRRFGLSWSATAGAGETSMFRKVMAAYSTTWFSSTNSLPVPEPRGFCGRRPVAHRRW
jgi:Acetyltransferase (GNAT) family